jgi:hypothetical protein
MIKYVLAVALALNLWSWGGSPGIILFSNLDKPLDKFKPLNEALMIFDKGKPIYYYIYNKKEFNVDHLEVIFIHVDNKGVIMPKTEITQTMSIDVVPGETAVKGKFTMWKDGQFMVRVFSPDNLEKPLAESTLLIK